MRRHGGLEDHPMFLNQRCIRSRGLACALLSAAVTTLAATSTAGADSSLKDAVTGGKVNVDLRYRYEMVDQDGFAEDARASTLRLRLGYTTAPWRNLFAAAQLEGLIVVGAEEYNSTANGLTQFPVVADPEDEEINQAFLGYSGIPNTVVRLGRQRITLNNHRFIGNVGWRQLEQTYDALSAVVQPLDDLSIFYGRLNNANRIAGEHHPNPALSDLTLGADLLNVSYRFPVGSLTGYAYLLELEDTPAASHKNLGLRFDGRRELSETVDLLYTVEYADQSDYKDGDPTNDADYLLVDVGVQVRKIDVRLAREVLAGDGTYAFQTPLATLHAHNGWADQFLVTPPDGLEDVFVALGTTLAGYRLAAIYHDYSADSGGADYGSELDLLVQRTFKGMYSFSVKYAAYDADTFSVDTDKFWISLWLRF